MIVTFGCACTLHYSGGLLSAIKVKVLKKVGTDRICSPMVSFIAKYQDTILLINDYLFLLCYLSGKDHL